MERHLNWHFVTRCEQVVAYKADLKTTMHTLAAWSWLLKDYLEKCPLHRDMVQPSTGMAARYIPRLENFPWYGKWKNGGKIPLPYMDRKDWNLKIDSRYRLVSWDEWLEDQVAEIADTDFLSESLWCGYWSFERQDQAGLPAIEFADAVEDLNIRAMQYIDEPVKNARRIIGSYDDHHIDFELEGYITPNGQFKLGPPGEFWAWFGSATPFGLFGFWGESTEAIKNQSLKMMCSQIRFRLR